MDRNKRKIKTLTYPGCEDYHVDEWRDWASLPRDVLCIVLSKLPQADILCGAGLVCSHMQRLALHEPQLWCHIDISDGGLWRHVQRPLAGWKSMAHAALDRSACRCETFIGHVDADVLVHLADRAPLLRNLCVAGWPFIPDTELVAKFIKKLPLLECVVMWSGSFQEELLVALLDYCPLLELLNVYYCRSAFSTSQEPTRTRIRSRNIKHFMPPHEVLD